MGNNSVAVGNDINYDYLLWHEQIMIGTRILAQCATPTRGVVPAGPPVIITSPLLKVSMKLRGEHNFLVESTEYFLTAESTKTLLNTTCL